MQVGYRRYADGFRIVVFQEKSVIVEWPDYMTVKREHNLERDDVRQFEALVPHERGLEFWKWCQVTENVAIKLDMQQEFHCPSCLTRKNQTSWSPPKKTHGNWYEIIARCGKCEAFYAVIYSMTDLKGRRR